MAAAIVDDVFSAAGEVLSAQDSTRKEFHCAVLRALSKEPSVADQAPGTPAEAESGLHSGLPLPSSPAQPSLVSLRAAAMGGVGIPACCVLSFFFSWGVLELAAIVLPCASILPTHSSVLQAFYLIIFLPNPLSLMSCKKASKSWQIRLPFCCLIGRGAEQRGKLKEALLDVANRPPPPPF